MPEKKDKKQKPPSAPSAQKIAAEICVRRATEVIYVESIDAFLVWRGMHHDLLEGLRLETWIWEFASEVFCDLPRPSSTIIKETVAQLRYAAPKRVESLTHDRLAFDDGYVDLMEDPLTPREHDPQALVVRRMPMRFADVLSKDCPLFKQFIASIMVGDDRKTTDESLVALIQEIFGYCLITSLPATAAFFFVGEGANGKSVLSEVLRAMVGIRYSSAMTLEKLTVHKFAASFIVGKYVNITNEEESKFVKSDTFKAIVSGDVITAERKFGLSFEFAPAIKLIFSTNETPTFDALNHGIRRRVKIIPFNRTITPEEQDPFLKDKLLAELPGITRWALDGLARLRANRYKFTMTSEAVASAVAAFEEESSAVVGFVNDTYDWQKVSTAFVSNEDMFEKYKAWCSKNNKKSKARIGMFKDLNRMFPAIADRMERRKVGGRTIRGYYVSEFGEEATDKPEPTF